eukprot:TRINITY_DN27144_c1_g1_i9.p1 TRINITY_DN27144_c1_g1~~TRINITY_DN27144_c1_g1_i9.p1  ORF type:complete len:677 (-),score=225.64 TRINITY_DN27144_c1_g1_i9:321-2351(-)
MKTPALIWLKRLLHLENSDGSGSAPATTNTTDDESVKSRRLLRQQEPTPLPATESGAALIDDIESDIEGQSEDDRQTWDNPIEFLLSCISMSVGLGNVWRFPFTAFENGGGAFLIPYLIVLLLIGRPLYLLELSIGQFSSSGCVKMWDLAPAFRGIGYGQSLATFIVCSYYCVLIGISCYYLFSSMQSVLPWTVCHPELAENSTICLPSSHNKSELNLTMESGENMTVVASTEQFFRRGVLKEVADISNGIGMPDPALVGCLVLCWLMIYLTLRKGVSSSGKVAYFTALFPYAVMLTLLVRGLTLPGSLEGIIFLFTPQWEKLLEMKVWYAAVTQSFFSLGIGFGCIITFSSYNRFNHNIYRDATIISIADTFTSTLAGIITFSILGHLAHELGVPIENVVKSGAGLAFISYPEVVAKFEFAPQLFAVLFFLMLITLGLGSAVGFVNVITTLLKDICPGLSKSTISGLVCLAGVAAGIVFTTPGGQPMLELVDYYGGSLLILAMAVCEVFVLAWVYGTNRIIRDLKFMMHRELGVYWRFCWTYLIPLTLTSILAYTIIFYEPVKYAKVELPLGAQLVGWAMFVTGLLAIASFMVFEFVRLGGWRRKFGGGGGGMFSPMVTWGPSKVQHRMDWINFTKHGDMATAAGNSGEPEFADMVEEPPLEIRTSKSLYPDLNQ